MHANVRVDEHSNLLQRGLSCFVLLWKELVIVLGEEGLIGGESAKV